MGCWRYDGAAKRFTLDDQSKQVKIFLVAVCYKRNRISVLHVSIELRKHSWKFGRTRQSWGNTRLRLVFPKHFSFSQTSTRVSIALSKHGTCFLFLKYSTKLHVQFCKNVFVGMIKFTWKTRTYFLSDIDWSFLPPCWPMAFVLTFNGFTRSHQSSRMSTLTSFTYKIISKIWMCVIHPVIENTNNNTSSRDTLPPDRHDIEVDTCWAGWLALI